MRRPRRSIPVVPPPDPGAVAVPAAPPLSGLAAAAYPGLPARFESSVHDTRLDSRARIAGAVLRRTSHAASRPVATVLGGRSVPPVPDTPTPNRVSVVPGVRVNGRAHPGACGRGILYAGLRAGADSIGGRS